MADVLTQLMQIQVGKESTWGTAVAQTLELAGVESFEPTTDIEYLANKEMGNFAPSRQGMDVGKTGASASMSVRASYDQIGVYFDSMLGTATPSGAGPYTRTWAGPTTSSPTRTMLTMCRGLSPTIYSLLGGVVSSTTLTFEPNAYAMAALEIVGKNLASDTLDSVSPSSVTYITTPQTTFAIDAIGGTPAIIECDILSMEIVMNTATTTRHGIGALTPCQYNYGEMEFTLNVVASAGNSTIRTLAESQLGLTPAAAKREVQIVSTSGTNVLTIDMVAALNEPIVFTSDSDGIGTFEISMSAYIDPSSNLTSDYLTIELVNGVAAYFA